MKGSAERRVPTVVGLLSNNYLLRLGLQRIVEPQTWIRLVGQTPNGATLEDLLTCEEPHIIIVDTEIASDVTGLIQKIKSADTHR